MLNFILGPCVIESREHTLFMARRLKEICLISDVPFVFKASFDKANRTSLKSYRGPGFEKGMEILQEVREIVPVITDVHEPWQCKADVDMLQIPAFLCRQTDLLLAAGETGKPILLKKGQFASVGAMQNAKEKIFSTGNRNVKICERGTAYGEDLLVDFRYIHHADAFDATHSSTNSRYVESLAKAAVAVGMETIFMEVHSDPANALSDPLLQYPLDRLCWLLLLLKEIREAVVNYG